MCDVTAPIFTKLSLSGQDNCRQKNHTHTHTHKSDKLFRPWHSVRDGKTPSPHNVFFFFWLRKERLKSPFLDTVCFIIFGLRSCATAKDSYSSPAPRPQRQCPLGHYRNSNETIPSLCHVVASSLRTAAIAYRLWIVVRPLKESPGIVRCLRPTFTIFSHY